VPAEPTEPLDRSMLAELSTVAEAATAELDRYDHTTALDATERFFWTFCDDYIELVKERAYGGDASARAALGTALSVQLRLFAPFLPYVTEEVWSWWRDGSVHTAPWPTERFDGDPTILAATAEALRQIRRAKSERNLSMRTEVAQAVIRGPVEDLDRIDAAGKDLRAAGRLAEVIFVRTAGDLEVSCTF
jgi:valyl-tRNA synthetase